MRVHVEVARDETMREKITANAGGGSRPNNIGKPPFKGRFFVLFFFSLSLLGGAFLSNRLFDFATTTVSFQTKFDNSRRHVEFPFDCTAFTPNKTCPKNYPTNWTPKEDPNRPFPATCPEYFRWIYEDLRLWAETGITREMVEMGRDKAHFRLVIVKGKAYVETYGKAFQTRDSFTLWGILQLLRWYPGKVPDLELMFNCDDRPVVLKQSFKQSNETAPPVMFHYCGDDATYDIVFPDWSFWGWPEVNLKSWEPLLKDLKEGMKKRKWKEREPYAYWKGNPKASFTREDLLKCNVSEKQDWNARLYDQDWEKESKQGYKESNLADQCVHRFKIYIEGQAWSVSQKYILACDSITLLIKSGYFDFFSRALTPLHHYWPIRPDDKCRSIKFAVDWGNSHSQKAKAIGMAGSKFIQEELKMEFIYDYMFHLLSEYSKLLTFKPVVPANAIELCPEMIVCQAEEMTKTYMMESAVKFPAKSRPCAMPPAYDPTSLHYVLSKNEELVKRVETWEKDFWNGKKKQP